jgi:hypothetical protein
VGLFEQIRDSMSAGRCGEGPSEEALASLSPEQRAAYDAQVARVAQAEVETQAGWLEAKAISDGARILDGPGGDRIAMVGEGSPPPPGRTAPAGPRSTARTPPWRSTTGSGSTNG